jgi:hypothetical protein
MSAEKEDGDWAVTEVASRIPESDRISVPLGQRLRECRTDMAMVLRKNVGY